MTVKTFFYGLIVSFGIPWLIILVVPFGTMRSLENPFYDEIDDERTDLFQATRAGRVENGSLIYGQEGCVMCHSQLTRPTYAGMDIFREGQGGFKSDSVRGDTRRITHAWDFARERRAHIGESRIGPDLGNFGNRLVALENKENKETAIKLGIKLQKEDKTPLSKKELVDLLGNKAFDKELYLFKHLYNPRNKGLADKGKERVWSICQANPQFFTKIGNYGQGTQNAVAEVDGKQIIPNDKGQTIVNYLMNLKKDDAVPYAMQYAKNKKKAGK